MLRKTKLEELEQVMKIIEDGRIFSKEQGINQWNMENLAERRLLMI